MVGFEEFMLVIANNLLRDSMYGTVYRVSVGALLSTIDAATDIYVIYTYYQSDELIGLANLLILMITGNLAIQLVGVFIVYHKMGILVLLRETLICLLFLRSAVDAFRVSTNHEDEDATVNQLSQMILNKSTELATER